VVKLRKLLDTEASHKEKLEEEIGVLRNQLLQMSLETDEVGVTACCKFGF
jgi:kinesin family member 5